MTVGNMLAPLLQSRYDLVTSLAMLFTAYRMSTLVNRAKYNILSTMRAAVSDSCGDRDDFGRR